jgi:hypothetical protein
MSEVSPDFAGTVALIALITDTKACAKRLDELRRLGAETPEAQSKLDADRAAHEAKVKADSAELAAREAKVAERLYRAMRLEREPPVDPVDPDDQFPFNPNLLPVWSLGAPRGVPTPIESLPAPRAACRSPIDALRQTGLAPAYPGPSIRSQVALGLTFFTNAGAIHQSAMVSCYCGGVPKRRQKEPAGYLPNKQGTKPRPEGWSLE